jgi:hypothetical protein
MAHFFDPSSKLRVGAIRGYTGGKVKVGLWGGGPETPSKPLVLTTKPQGRWNDSPDPAIKLVESQPANWTFIYEIDMRIASSKKVRALCAKGDWSEPLDIILSPTPNRPMGKLQTRRAIVDEALSHVANGHYLWGTAGNLPGAGGGNFGKETAAKIRDASLDAITTSQDKVLAVNMAFQSMFDGYNSCAGRSKKFATGADPDLNEYRQDRAKDVAQKNPQLDWGSAKGLFPRKYHFRGSLKDAGKVFWGEACQGHKHFDCVGLVNYCYGKFFTGKAYANEIATFRTTNSGFVFVPKGSECMNGDVLIPPAGGYRTDHSHIAMLYEASPDVWKVVQATETEVGLTSDTAYNDSHWDRFRMLDSLLK